MSKATWQHRQSGTAMLAVLGVAAAVDLLLAVAVHPAALAGLPVLGGLAVLFASLTLQVTPQAVAWHFGPGVWARSVPMAEIAEVRRVPWRWWQGLGIRRVARGWLYTVSGGFAVEITRRDGSRVAIGADAADSAVAAIEAARAGRG